MLNEIKIINFLRFRQIVASGDQNAIRNAEENFGATVNNPYWNYKN